MQTALEMVAPWPPWITILLVVVAAVVACWLYAREESDFSFVVRIWGAGLRFALICVVLWMMYGATVRPFRTDLPDLLLMIDDSSSMSTVDPPSPGQPQVSVAKRLRSEKITKPHRLNLAKSLLLREDARLVASLQEQYQLRLATLEEPLRSYADVEELTDAILQVAATGEQSRLGSFLRESLRRQRGRPLAAIVVLTDGITTEGPPLSEVASHARQRGAPMHVVGLGSELPPADIRLSDLLVDEVVFAGDVVTFDVTVHASGYPGQTLAVQLRRADGMGQPIRKQVSITGEQVTEAVRLSFQTDEVGKIPFLIETAVRDGEINDTNNTLTAEVEVRDAKTRVLLVQSYPSYEYHYLKTLFERQQRDNQGTDRRSVELNVLLQEADPEFANVDNAALRRFPLRDELFEYDVCIFGDVNPSYLGREALENLRDFVRERGRGFIGIAGPRFFPAAYVDSPLAEILPFDPAQCLSPPADLPIESGFRIGLTDLGRQLPSMQLAVRADENERRWDALPEMYWLLEVGKLKSGVRVLSEHPTRTGVSGHPLPVTMLSYVGAGNVLFHATDDSWRWRIGMGDALFARYWTQSVRYLSRFKLGQGREVELMSDRRTYQRGDVVRLRARFFDESRAPDVGGVTVILQQKGRDQQKLVLQRDALERGMFVADVANLNSGGYHAWVAEPVLDGAAPSVDFDVIAPDTEWARLEMDAADLRRAAEISGGRFYNYQQAGSLLEHLPVGRQVRIESLPPRSAWNTWPIACLFMLLLGAEWGFRRLLGML